MKTSLWPLFSQSPLNRLDNLRGSVENFFTENKSSQSIFILINEDKLIMKDDKADCFFNFNEISSLGVIFDEMILLGTSNDKYYFTKEISNDFAKKYNSIDLRSYALANTSLLDDVSILAQAFSILKWHETHKFCPACGGRNIFMKAGWRLDCSECGREHFPRVDPVVIMLVTHNDYCLLGSGIKFQSNRYSCLAGFIEPGETIEDAARRELFEEAGVVGLDVKYICSQPWPFPFNLMIGVHVIAKDKKLTIDYEELSDARWVKKSDVLEVLNGSLDLGFTLPPEIAIAWTLLDYWVNG